MVALSDAQLLQWVGWLLAPLFRVIGLMMSAPVLSNRALPLRARIAIALAIVVCIAPQAQGDQAWSLGSPTALLDLARELGIGLIIGLLARLVFGAFELAGEIIGLQLGLSFAAFFDPTIGASNPMTRIIHTLALLAFVTLNGPQMLIAGLTHSYQTMPIGTALFEGRQALELAGTGASLFSTGVMIALPFIGLLLIVNLILGVVSRIAPQMNVFAVGFPITIGAGLVLVALGLPLIEAPLMELTQTMLRVFLR
jgi:flagellar biosynthetic protein FliR